MKKFSLLFLLSFVVFSLQAQLKIEPGIIEFHKSKTESFFDIKVEVTNETDKDQLFTWKLVKGADFPEEWTVMVCDVDKCYPSGIWEICKNGNVLMANSSFEFKMTFNTSGVKAETSLQLQLFEGEGCENEKLIVESDETGLLKVGGTTDVLDVVDQASFLFPNPCADVFQIKELKDTDRVRVLNMQGQLVLEPSVLNEYIEVGNLTSGSYIVQIIDKIGSSKDHVLMKR